MKKGKKAFLITGGILGSIVMNIVLTIGIIVGLVLLIDAIVFPEPEKPAVTYGEFPFTIVYEIDGEIKTIEDAYICKYGVSNNTSSMGKFRIWKMHLASNRKESSSILWHEGNITLTCHIGTAAYYMGEIGEHYNSESYRTPHFTERIKEEGGGITYHSISAEEVWEKYKIRIISYESSDRIENSFPEDSPE